MKTSTLIILILVSQLSKGQDFIVWQGDTINRIDKNRMRQGIWSFSDNQSGIQVEMNIINDIPGDSILYFENKRLRLVYIKSKQDSSCYVYFDGKFSCTGSITKTTINYCSQDNLICTQIKKLILFEIYPIYYGGQEAMIEYLAEKVKAFPANETGTVKVSFTIDKTGKPSDVKISSSGNEKLNSYCIRAIQEMPRWQAGFQGGAVVTVPMIIPIVCK